MASQAKSAAPAIIQKLVETFEQNLDSYRSSKNETELRREFLDKFFTALGWDVANEKGYDEAHKEVLHEFSVEVAGQGKKADYAFRTGADKFDFLVEAKKPSVKIESSQDAAFQIRRYGWSAKLPINILTDFEHFAVYDCRAKPNYSDKASFGRIMLIHYKEYVERWDEIASVFSPEAVRQGSFAKYAEGMKGKKGTADVDDAFLHEIERWRELLARNIALRNEEIDIAGLNYAVQMTIDRIVFLRICEERGIEPENQLLDIATPTPTALKGASPKSDWGSSDLGEGREGVYAQLCELFKRADTKYNSGLFHFKKEKEMVSRPDDLTLNLDIDDKVLKDIISNLYYPKSPYAFLYIPTEILGSVYERFLGKVIRLTAGHQAKVEEKPEVRKAGGVYYTPTYIVDYIVKNTVGRIANPTTPAVSRIVNPTTPTVSRIANPTYTPKDVAKLKIVDPACGSGTFLLGAYQYLLDWHLNWYVTNEPEKWVKQKALVRASPSPTGRGQGEGGWRLTTSKKKEILLNNIHGVDIDAQAVEVAKLSLLLKVLENASGQLGLGMERVLPDLGNNIKCGNSLIGFDYFEGQLLPDEEERARVNPFDWKSEFKDVFAKGGFDVVIGNPPYLFITELETFEKDYYFKKYTTTEYRFDVYGLFTELSVQQLLRNGGYASFIIPHTLLSNDSFEKLRKLLLSKTFIEQVVDIGPGVFVTARNETMIFVVQKGSDARQLTSVVVTNSKQFPTPIKKFELNQSEWENNPKSSWLVKVANNEVKVLANIERTDFRLGELCTINQGLRTGDNEKYLSDNKHNSSWKHAAGGKHVGRYKPLQEEIFVLYEPELLDAPRRPEIFDSPEKLVVQEIRNITLSRRIVATFDNEQYYCLQSTNVINIRKDNKTGFELKYLLGILNSTVANYFFRQKFSGNNHIASNQLAQIPIPSAEKAKHDKMVSLVEQMLALHKEVRRIANPPHVQERLERQIEVTDKAIDSLVYELYGLNEAEIKIVEGE